MNSIESLTRWFALIRAVHFGATLLICCVFLFDRLIVAPSAKAQPSIDQRWRGISRFLILFALPAALLSGLGWIWCLATEAAGDGDMTVRQAMDFFWNQTVFGGLWKFRSIVLIATTALALPAVLLRNPSKLRTTAVWLALACSTALVGALSRAGHGGEGAKSHQLADSAHLLIGAAWPLGLVPLAFLLLRLRREPNPDRWISVYDVTSRFSSMSVTSVILLTATGIANAWPLVGTLSNLTSTVYGKTLLVKVGLFALMVLSGGLNRLYLQPRLSVDYATGTEAKRLAALSRLQLTVWLEIALGIGVMLAVGLLGRLPPATEGCCALCEN